MFNPRWFNLSSPELLLGKKRVYFRLWNLFNRHTAEGEHWWGFGVLQIGRRHLFYIGYNSASILFIGQSA